MTTPRRSPGTRRSSAAPVGAARALALAAAAVLGGCGDSGAGADEGALSLSLEAISPPTDAPLALNEEIRLVFSGVIDPTTVTAESVRLVEKATGERALGDWTVDGRMLRFIPDGVTRRDLRGGGYPPGAELRLVVGGFPRISAVRSVAGEALAAPVVADFRVVSADSDGVFLDASPDETAPLQQRPSDPGATPALPLEHDGALVVACDEPLDPRTLFPEDFEFARVRSRPGAAPLGPDGDGELEVVPVQYALLVKNGRDAGDDGPAALIRFFPGRAFDVERLAAEEYVLRPRAGLEGGIRLRDFSGGTPDASRLLFSVARYDEGGAEGAETYAFDFLDRDDLAPLADETCDGAAHWHDTGRVSVRYPRAAGDGGDGEVALPAGAYAGRNVHATRITLDAGVDCRLRGDGLVVLRAQGRIDLDGRLLRRLEAGADPPPMWDPREVLPGPGRGGQTLTQWLDAALGRDAPWTVVIAGGDVVIRGEVDVDTPLLIVAGGRIRGRRAPTVAGDQLWLLGDGGFDFGARSRAAASNPPPPLAIDPPIVNRLRETLTFVAYSAPVPKAGAPRQWGLPRITARDGAHGEAQVAFIDAEIRAGASGGFDAGQAVRHVDPMGVVREPPGSVGDGARVRLRVELVVRPDPGGAWDPPLLDRVLLTWTQDPKR